MNTSLIKTQENKIVFAIANSRVIATRIFGIVILLLVLFTGHSFDQGTIIDISFELSGLLLLSMCSMGRLWALMYISGNKRLELVTDGPYSIVRHPLYLFSLIGSVGIGLASENLLVLVLIVMFYLLYYPFTILAEERKLTKRFGDAYLEYIKRTPRFIPKFSLYKKTQLYEVKAASFVRNLVDGMWFIWIFMLLHFVEMLQESGYLPVFLRVP